MKAESLYDTQNSKLVVTIYHKEPWFQSHKPRDSTYHFLKFTKETEDYNRQDPYVIELNRIGRILASKVKNFGHNPMKRLCLYSNDNKGRTVKAENRLLMLLEFQNNQLLKMDIRITDPQWQNVLTALSEELSQMLHNLNF